MLVTTIDQVRQVVGSAVRKENSFDILAPYLKTAESSIAQLISREQLAELSQPGADDTLKDLAISAIVWNGYQQAWHQAFYNFSGTGVNRSAAKDHEALFRYQEDQIKDDIVRKADEAIENLMLYLETNINSFQTYKDSPEYERNFSYLISTPGALHKALPEVSKSFRMYMVLRGYMFRVELKTVKAVIGEGLFDQLKEKIANAEQLDTNYAKLLTYCQQYLAPATLLEAMPWISVQFSPTGIRIVKVFNNLKDENPLSDTQNLALMMTLQSRIDDSKLALKTFLNSVASETIFPEFYNSSLYSAPGSNPWKLPDNAGKKHFRL